jgi:UDP-N-acetylglucosamine:LPS N-acetylglucosamine transferase
MGMSMERLPELKSKKLPLGVKIVSNYAEGAIRIPENMLVNAQDLIAAMNLVVSKAGYSTVAEAITARVPVIMTAREGFIDDEAVSNGAEKLGIGMRVSNESFMKMDYLDNCRKFAERAKTAYKKLPKRFSSPYNKEAAELILSC